MKRRMNGEGNEKEKEEKEKEKEEKADLLVSSAVELLMKGKGKENSSSGMGSRSPLHLLLLESTASQVTADALKEINRRLSAEEGEGTEIVSSFHAPADNDVGVGGDVGGDVTKDINSNINITETLSAPNDIAIGTELQYYDSVDEVKDILNVVFGESWKHEAENQVWY
jgi:hypothetical protein